jgi:tetratricopeptide (TPR) repeat protein
MRNLIPTALVVVSCGVARAEVQGAKQAAEVHVARATELHQQGELAQALVELKTAYALDPRPPLLFAMGQLHVQLGECPQAITYYERFLSTSPPPPQASLASQAIDTCKTHPPIVEPRPQAPAAPEPAEATSVEATAASSESPGITATSPQEVPTRVGSRDVMAPGRWSPRFAAGALAGGGVLATTAALLVYRSAVGMRADADGLADYQRYAQRIDAAHTRRNIAIVLGASGAALAVAGGAYYFFSQRGRRAPGVVVTPGDGGGVVSWSGRW